MADMLNENENAITDIDGAHFALNFIFILPGNNPIEIQNLFFKGVLAKTAE